MKSEDFLASISQSLGRDTAPTLAPAAATHLSHGAEQVHRRAQRVAEDITSRADELMAHLEQSAAEAAWNVFRTQSPLDAANYIRQVAMDVEARTMLRSTHSALDALDIEAAMHGTGISLGVMAVNDDAPGDTLESERHSPAPAGNHSGHRNNRRGLRNRGDWFLRTSAAQRRQPRRFAAASRPHRGRQIWPGSTQLRRAVYSPQAGILDW